VAFLQHAIRLRARHESLLKSVISVEVYVINDDDEVKQVFADTALQRAISAGTRAHDLDLVASPALISASLHLLLLPRIPVVSAIGHGPNNAPGCARRLKTCIVCAAERTDVFGSVSSAPLLQSQNRAPLRRGTDALGETVYLCFVDESGSHGTSPVLVVGGIIIHEEDVWHLQQRLEDGEAHDVDLVDYH